MQHYVAYARSSRRAFRPKPISCLLAANGCTRSSTTASASLPATLPPGGFRSVLLEIDAFHRDRRIPVRRGRSRHEAEQFYIRFCFPDTATADAFRNRFGGECLTHAPLKPKQRT